MLTNYQTIFFAKYDLQAEVEWKQFPSKKLKKPVFQVKEGIRLWNNGDHEGVINPVKLAEAIQMIHLSLAEDW